MKRQHVAAIAFVLVSAHAPQIARAEDVEAFYRDKTMQTIVGYGPGGGYDLYARLVSRFLGNHIPGQPAIVVRNMPGGGGRVATSYVYEIAPKDGTILLTADQSLVLEQAIGDPAIRFDLSKMPPIGNPNAENNNLVTWHGTGVTTIADAQKKEVTIGAGPGASTQVPLVMNAILKTKFKIVSGYTGGNEINLAMERGEVGGRGQNSFAAWKASKPDWLRDHRINFIVQWGAEKLPEYTDVPLLSELAEDESDRALLKLFSAPTVLGRPLFTTPGAPSERVVALRKAFETMMVDPVFLGAAKAGSFDLNPVSGEKMEAVVKEALATPKDVRERLRKIVAK